MKSVEIKNNLHKIIDAIQNEQLLRSLYEFLSMKKHVAAGKLWASLSAEQKNELMVSFDESENDDNLLDASSLFSEHE